jgi:hypothetical protein
MNELNFDYPVYFNVDYAEKHSRLTVFFRWLLIVPIELIFYVLARTIFNVILPVLLMILFRKKYPKWLFDFNVELSKFGSRIMSYLYLLTDKYPSTYEEQDVNLQYEYPDMNQLNRFLPLIKWLLVLPHYIILFFLFFISAILTFIAWLAILITGKYPRFIFKFNVMFFSWSYRVQAYAFLLTTDKYPPFRL